jgi:hypothetical protein
VRAPDNSGINKAVAILGEGFYWNRFQEPGRAERDFASIGTKETLKRIIAGAFGRGIAPHNKELTTVFPVVQQLPPWFSEEDLEYYTKNFSKTGFTGPLNYYRNMHRFGAFEIFTFRCLKA